MRTLTIIMSLAGFLTLISPVKAQPKIEFPEATFNAGTVWEGAKVPHVYTLRNAGNEELDILRVKTSCGCTAAKGDKDKIAPGEEGTIKVEFNTTRRSGRQAKHIYVHSNDPASPTSKLTIECFVQTVATFKPRALFFNNVIKGQTPIKSIILQPAAGPFTITGVEVNKDFFEVILPEDKKIIQVSEKNEPIEIKLKLNPNAPLGKHSASLKLTTDHPQLSQINARIRAEINGLVSYVPRMMFFNRDDLLGSREKIVKITKTGTPDLVITRPEVTIEGFDLDLIPIREKEEYDLHIKPIGVQEPGRKRGFVIFRTNQAEQEEIKIPISSYLPKSEKNQSKKPEN